MAKRKFLHPTAADPQEIAWVEWRSAVNTWWKVMGRPVPIKTPNGNANLDKITTATAALLGALGAGRPTVPHQAEHAAPAADEPGPGSRDAGG